MRWVSILLLFSLISNIVLSLESKVVIDGFTATQDNSFTLPDDCRTGDFVTDNSILGGGRLISYDGIVNDLYFTTCDYGTSCELSSSIENGSWLIETSNQVSGDCQLTAKYEGNYVDYSINGGEEFRLSTNGATSFRIVASVSNAPVEVFVKTDLLELLRETIPVGTNQEVVVEFPDTLDAAYRYYDYVSELVLGVSFSDSGSIEIHTFETYGPENSQNPNPPLPPPASTNVETVFILDSFDSNISESGSNDGDCVFLEVDSSTDTAEFHRISFNVCQSPIDASSSITESNGQLQTSLTTGVKADFSLSYSGFGGLDLCQGDGLLIRYSSVDEMHCSARLSSNDDDEDCRTTFLLDPSDEARVLLFDDFAEQDCALSRLLRIVISCEIFGNSQGMKWNSVEYICSDNDCSCSNNNDNSSGSSDFSSIFSTVFSSNSFSFSSFSSLSSFSSDASVPYFSSFSLSDLSNSDSSSSDSSSSSSSSDSSSSSGDSSSSSLVLPQLYFVAILLFVMNI